jgi:hypothetical protein
MNNSTCTPHFPTNLEEFAPWVKVHGLLAPYGECQCGCGQLATLSPQNNKTAMVRKGDPYRWVKGHHKHGLRKPLAPRFWAKVNKTDKCWEWTGCKTGAGYGQIRVEGKSILAHRISWEMHHGHILGNMFVLHHCDNPSCVRPDHLFVGSNVDNVQDMISKGRKVTFRGDHVVSAQLTNDDAKRIRIEYQSGTSSARQIAKRYGVSHTTILGIVNNKRYVEG